jgi:hypothetical protein
MNQIFFVSTTASIAASCLKDEKIDKDGTKIIGVIDFGSQGLTFSAFKLHATEPGIV